MKAVPFEAENDRIGRLNGCGGRTAGEEVHVESALLRDMSRKEGERDATSEAMFGSFVQVANGG